MGVPVTTMPSSWTARMLRVKSTTTGVPAVTLIVWVACPVADELSGDRMLTHRNVDDQESAVLVRQLPEAGPRNGDLHVAQRCAVSRLVTVPVTARSAGPERGGGEEGQGQSHATRAPSLALEPACRAVLIRRKNLGIGIVPPLWAECTNDPRLPGERHHGKKFAGGTRVARR